METGSKVAAPPISSDPRDSPIRLRSRRWHWVLLSFSLLVAVLFFAVIFGQRTSYQDTVEQVGGQFQAWDQNPVLIRTIGMMTGQATKCHQIRFVQAQVNDEWLRRNQRELFGMTNLSLTMQQSSVTNKGVEQLRGMQQLRFLDLMGTKLPDSEMESISTLRGLSMLNLALTGISAKALGDMTGPRLSGIGIDRSHLTEEGILILQGMTSLFTLECQARKFNV